MSKNIKGLNDKVEKLRAKLKEAEAELTAKQNEIKIETADKLYELCSNGGFEVDDVMSMLSTIVDKSVDIQAVMDKLPDLYNSRKQEKADEDVEEDDIVVDEVDEELEELKAKNKKMNEV